MTRRSAFSLVAAALLAPSLLPCLGADPVTLESIVTMNNLQWLPLAGTLEWLSNWELEASVGTFDSDHGFAHDYQFKRQTAGTQATAVGQITTVYTRTSAQVSADANGTVPGLAFSTRSVFLPPVSSIHASGWATAYREFKITGGSGPVSVTFSFDYAVKLYGTVRPGQYASSLDYGAAVRVTDGATTWELTDAGKRSAPVDVSFGGTRSVTFALQYNVPYSMGFSAYDAATPEPLAAALVSGLALAGFAALRRGRKPTGPARGFSVAEGLHKTMAAAVVAAIAWAQGIGRAQCPDPGDQDCTDPCNCPNGKLLAGSFVSATRGEMGDEYSVATLASASGPTVNLFLTYSSTKAFEEPLYPANTCLGFGWTHSCNVYLFRQQGMLFRRDSAGRTTKYARVPDTYPVRYVPSPAYPHTVLGYADGSYAIHHKDGTIEKFGSFAGCPYFHMSPLYQMTERADRNDNKTVFDYDATGRLAKVTDPYGRQITFTYNAYDKVETITDPVGNVTRLDYAELGCKLVQITDPLGHTVRYEYDNAYRVTKKVDKNGTTYLYRLGGGKITAEVVSPSGQRVSLVSAVSANDWAFDMEMLVKHFKRVFVPGSAVNLDSLGQNWVYAYDSNAFITSITAPDGSSQEYAYDPTVLLPSVKTDPNGRTTRYEYDSLGNRTKVTDALTNVTSYTYEPVFSQMTSLTDPNGRITFWQYDERGNRTNEISPAPFLYTRSWTYDQHGLVTSETDRRGNTTSFAYDANGNLAATTNALGYVTWTRYDPLGRLLWRIDPNGHASVYTHDALGRLVAQSDGLTVPLPWPPPAPDPVPITVQVLSDGAIRLDWEAGGWVLTRAEDIRGPFADVFEAGQPVMASPYLVTAPLAQASAYFRLRYDPSPVSWPQQPPEPVPLGVQTLSDGSIRLDWEGTGWTLARAESPLGPFEEVLIGGQPVTTSPYVVPAPLSQTSEYFRLCAGPRVSGLGTAGQSAEAGFGGSRATPSQAGRSTVRLLTNGAAGEEMTYAYDAMGNRTNAIDCLGRETPYTYDYRNRLVLTTDALGYTIGYAYDDNNNRTAVTNQNGYVTRFEYDGRNRLTNTIDALGYSTSQNHDRNGNVVSETDANTNTTFYAYDALNRRTNTVDALGGMTQFQYADAGSAPCCSPASGSDLVTRKTDANGKVTYFKYDALDRLTQVIRKQGETADVIDDDDAVTAYTYDPNGNRLTVATRITATEYITNTFAYDALNREIARANGAGDITLTTYDPAGNPRTIAAPNGNISTTTYDAKNRVLQVDDLIGRVANYSYDCVGNRLSEADGNGNTTRYAYDAVNRLVTTTDAMGSTSTDYYDPVGNLIKTTDRMSNSTFYAYDALNRRVAETNALSYVTQYDYDGVGNVTRLTDANGHATEFAYDEANRLIREIYPDLPCPGEPPDSNKRFFTYDAVGNVTSRNNQDGSFMLYAYSDLYLLTNRASFRPDGSPSTFNPPARFTHDLAGRMLSAAKTNWLTDEDWLVTFAYDGADRVTNTTQNGRVVAYAFDAPGRTRTLVYPGGRAITEQFDARVRLSAIGDGTLPPIASYDYDLGNRVQTRTYRNGVLATYGYNANNWVVSLEHAGGGTRIAGFGYEYDREGNKRCEEKRHQPVASEAYQYDATYQLTNSTVGTLATCSVPSPITYSTWDLDPTGNWTSRTTDGTPENRTHNAANEILTINAVTISHDANGNLTVDDRYDYTYDEENRLVQLTRKADGVVVGRYVYDALGRRVVKGAKPAPPSVETRYFYDDQRIIEDQDAGGVTLAAYTYGNYIDEAVTMDRGGQVFHYHHNALWSVGALTDSVGTVVERYAYDAYGGTTVSDGRTDSLPLNSCRTAHSAIGNPCLFTGRLLDEESGLYFYRARYYHCMAGRFLQRDSVGFSAGVNLYAYVLNDPINHTDPAGNDGTCSYGCELVGQRDGRYFFDICVWIECDVKCKRLSNDCTKDSGGCMQTCDQAYTYTHRMESCFFALPSCRHYIGLTVNQLQDKDCRRP